MPKRILKRVKLEWCNFNAKDNYGKRSCRVILDDSHVAQLEAWGVGDKVRSGKSIKNKDYQFDGSFLQLAQREADWDGNELGPVPVCDNKRQPLTAQVGNGSIGNVKVDIYEYKKYGGGTAIRLEEVQILDLVPYGDDEDFDEDDGDEAPF